jgi:HrpA-like RNA helicase
VPLAELALQVAALKSHGSEKSAGPPHSLYGRSRIAAFLAGALEPPEYHVVTAAISQLRALGALEATEALTPLGQALVKLPVHPRIGKMLILGSALGCPQPMLTIGAAACQRDPFISPMAMRTEADRAKKAFSSGCASARFDILPKERAP